VRILAQGNGWRETPVEVVWAEVRVGEELNRCQGVLKLRLLMQDAVKVINAVKKMLAEIECESMNMGCMGCGATRTQSTGRSFRSDADLV
jgi:hypothetical protein